MRKVKVKYKYGDITFCDNFKCRKKTCYRHVCHSNNPFWISVSPFEGKLQYCLKEYEKVKGEK